MKTTDFSALYGSEGYRIERIHAAVEMAQVDLRWDARCKPRCPTCQHTMGMNRKMIQAAYDLPLASAATVLLTYEAIQGYCARCQRHHTVRPLEIMDGYKSTLRLMRYVSRLCRYLPLSQVGQFVPVPAATAYRWDKWILRHQLPEPNLDGLEVLIIDEKAVRRHHGYVTLVMNGRNGELLHLAEGKKKESLRAFFAKLSLEQKESIAAVCIDRAGAYRSVVETEVPWAEIVYDKFHLIANYNAVIDEVRRGAYAKAQAADKAVIKGQRYNLFRNPENLSEKGRGDLTALLEINHDLHVAYLLKDGLKALWTYVYPKAAENYLRRWVGWAKEAAIPSLTRFANGLLEAKEQITNFCKHPITSARLESFNATVSRIIHKACGITNLDYLFLKLRQESLKSIPQP